MKEDIETYNDDSLKKMLNCSTVEQPSAEFTDMLMSRLRAEKAVPYAGVKEVKPKQWLFIILSMLVVLVGALIWIFTTYTFDFTTLFSFDFSFVRNSFENLASGFKNLGGVLGNARYAVYFGLVVLFLLTTDLLVRKRIFNKHEKQAAAK